MKKIVLILAMMLFSVRVWAMEPPNLPPDIALEKLKDGNTRFAAYQMKYPHQNKTRRTKLINGQHPFAVILSCSDSRVSPEIIFDQGLGDIFVIRNAGNVIDENVLAGIDYALHKLGINLVVVLGHQFCGEIGESIKESSSLNESLKQSIEPAITQCKKDKTYSYEKVIKTHAQLTAETILEDEKISKYMKKHDVRIIPAYYSINTSKVEFLK